jgi:hypothetical protein
MDKKLKYSIIGISCIGVSVMSVFVGYQIFNYNVEPIEIVENNAYTAMIGPTLKEVDTYTSQVRVNSDTKIVYEYHYIDGGIAKKNYESLPYFLVGLTEVELQSRFNEWEITEFSINEVVLRKYVEKNLINQYVIGVKDGFVAIFYEDSINAGRLKQLTNTPVSALAKEEQEKLKEGIVIKGEKELIQALESYGS